MIGGFNATSKLKDRLLSLTIKDAAGVKSDTVKIVLDDRDNRLIEPPDGAPVGLLLHGHHLTAGLCLARRDTGKTRRNRQGQDCQKSKNKPHHDSPYAMSLQFCLRWICRQSINFDPLCRLAGKSCLIFPFRLYSCSRYQHWRR